MLENHLKKSYFLVLGEIGYCFSFYFLHIINWDVGVQLLVLISVKPPKLWSWICKKARNQRRRWVTRAWEVMPSQSLVIGFYLGMRSHMILVVIPHDKQRYLYSFFAFKTSSSCTISQISWPLSLRWRSHLVFTSNKNQGKIFIWLLLNCFIWNFF